MDGDALHLQRNEPGFIFCEVGGPPSIFIDIFMETIAPLRIIDEKTSMQSETGLALDDEAAKEQPRVRVDLMIPEGIVKSFQEVEKGYMTAEEIDRPVLVELLASPFCMADRDNKTVGEICQQLGADYRLLNMWDIDDEMEGIPEHIAILIREYRTGQRPGNLYSNAFINGQRVLLDRWPSHLDDIRTLIKRAKEEDWNEL